MSRQDALNAALDRFTVPQISGGLVEQVVRAATDTQAMPVPRRRAQRVLWRNGRRTIFGVVAVGLISATAVASGLLGGRSLHLPTFAALTPPAAVAHPTAKIGKLPMHRERRVKPSVAPATVVAVPEPAVPMPRPIERLAARVARQAERREFFDEHPRAAMLIVRRVRQQLSERALARQAVQTAVPIEESNVGGQPVSVEASGLLAREAALDRRRARAMIDRRIERFRRRAELSAQSQRTGAEVPKTQPALPTP